MSFTVKEVEGGIEGLHKLISSVPLNTGMMDAVNTTLTIQVVAGGSSRTSTHVLRRESTLQPSLEHWYSWSNLFKLRRMHSSVESTNVDDFFSVDENVVFLEQSYSNGEGSAVWYKLFSSSNKEEATAACESLKRTLKHFAAARIPEDLLISLVLPQPKTLVEIPKVVFEYLKSKNGKADKSFLVDLHINNFPLTYHACTSDEPYVLKYLLSNGADIFYKDSHTGNSLLHTAAKFSHSCVVVLLDIFKQRFTEEQYNEYINKLNHYYLDSKRLKNPDGMHILSFALSEMNILGLAPHKISPEPSRKEKPGVSPLMLAVGDENIKSTGVLLALGADPSIMDPSLKTTALHIAAANGNESLIQLLLSFGASTDCKNEDNETPLDLAKKSSNSSKCVELLTSIGSLRKHAANSWGNGKVRESRNKNGEFLLCIDGGGTRALIPVFILNLVEQRMRNISKTKNLRISRYFNWLSGTSAGSFITLGMVYQSLSPSRILTSIIAERDKLFSGTRIYSEEGLKEFIKGVVGDTKFVDEVKEPKVIIPTTLADRSPPESILIRNYNTDPNSRRWMVHEAVHASAAVPTYFPAFEKKYVDGGLMVPNPTLVTITESLTNGSESGRPIAAVVSLGTGSPPTTDMDLTEIVYPRLSSFLSDVKQDFKYIYHLVDMLTANISNLGHTVAQSRAWCKSMGSNFYRFSPELTSRHDLDTKDDSAMADIFYETYLYCLKNAEEIENLAYQLLNNGPQH